MDSNLLKIFTTVTKSKSFTLGAKKLNVTQANVTLRIKQLEKELGYKLFHRVPKGIILTKEGEKLLPLANEIDKKFKEIHMQMKNINSQDSLIVASTYTNASKRLIPFLQKIRVDFPTLELELIRKTKIPIVKLLLEYKIDIGFINHEPDDSEIMVLNKFDNELLFLQQKDSSVENHTILAYEENCAYHSGMKKYYEHIGVSEYDTIEIADFEVILACVELGMGESIIPKSIVEKLGYLEKLKTTKIPNSVLEIPTCLVCRKDNVPQISEYLKNIDID
ncbi:LysR family transcriptional regulator [Sulfurospirillum arcachonense]|uniref:LysR family transcriptional regulator n=1 Tax=Sulfurospirillum arcachonense TaxID=57666 RepID=UPI00046A4421|nr:LysR family transcriptional regulator [Sulfurospirillum arcachonense]